MNREKAEKLLAVLLFDDLDASSKEELTAYLQTDDELRERLTDMRMAVKVTSDALENEPELTLSPKRLKKLSRLARKGNKRSVIFTMRYIATAAAVLAVIALPTCFIFIPSLTKVRKMPSSPMALEEAEALRYSKASRGRSHGGEFAASTSVARSDRDNLDWNRSDGIKVAGGISNAVEMKPEPSTEEERMIAQVFDSEDLYSDTLKGGAMMGGGRIGGGGSMGGGSYGGMGGMGSMGGRGGMGNTFNERENRTNPVVDGRSASVPEGEKVYAPASGAATRDELSLGLNDRGIVGDDGRAFGLRTDPPPPPSSPARVTTRSPAPTPTPRPVSPPVPVIAPPDVSGPTPSRTTAVTGTPTPSPDITVSRQPIAPTEPGPGEWRDNAVNGSGPTPPVVVFEEGKANIPLLGDIPIISGLSKTEATKDSTSLDYTQSEISADESNKTAREILEANDALTLYQKQALIQEWYAKEISKLHEANSRSILNSDDEISELQEAANARSIPYSEDISSPQDWKPVAKARQEYLSYLDLFAEDISYLPAASRFKSVPVNPWVMTQRDALSTFALDVDTASYTLSRRYISSGYLPPAGAVRMEEFINYFNYQYPQQSDRTFKVYSEAAASPFAGEGKNLTLLKIGVKARTIGRDQFRPAHLVFVIDTSASMGQPDRLPLIQQALNMLIDSLNPSDRVTLITCSDQAHLLLDAVPVSQHESIRQVINAIQPSGTTNLLAGLQLGYASARRAYSAKQINQIVLCSDGVANVGQTEAEAVLKAVAQDRQQGITITCVGVGYGTYNDAFMESLANQGDGRYVFLDSLRQAQRVFVEQLAATLHTVAKDARIQVSFNPERVRRYRLIGYENRDIEDARFRDDTIDAGEVGAGQCSTALYELEMIDGPSASSFDDFGTVFVRYRNVDTDQIEEISYDLENTIVRTRTVEDSPYFYLAATAAQFAEILRESEHVQGSHLRDVLIVADKLSRVLGLDRDVRELAELIRRSENLPRVQ